MDERASELCERAKAAMSDVDDLGLERIARELVAYGEGSGEPEARAYGYAYLGIALMNLNRGTEAALATREAIDYFTSIGAPDLAARHMMNFASIELDINLNIGEARRLYEQSIELIRASQEPQRLAIALGNLAELLRLEHNYRDAIATAKEAVELFLAIEDFASVATGHALIAHCRALTREYSAAIAGMHEAYRFLQMRPNPRFVAAHFDTWVMIAKTLGDLEVGARILAFVDRYRFDHYVRRLQGMLPWLSEFRERIALELSDERLQTLTAEGETLTVEAAQALAETLGDAIPAP